MMPIDEAKCVLLVRVSVLHKAAPEVLSAFELETLWQLNQRALEMGDDAEITAEEWAVVERAHDALERSLRGMALSVSPETALFFGIDCAKRPSHQQRTLS
jgi:hypothetical protein